MTLTPGLKQLLTIGALLGVSVGAQLLGLDPVKLMASIVVPVLAWLQESPLKGLNTPPSQ